ncbi:2'-5' RNA ligase family protein [Deinococcus cellulosilyticus]|uniref:2'-5' RNA ligase family protein n=1 Tax=Deinococcus cellulosilyticus (strain DSM 18568 / NBRC 106333 / KACC 11606 / 5516J-15) TaxID=1223518 RepID=A0A511N4M1_DEIC1|nr:2'-5' RNA ligase family protein [Deinococcus cellulosilyticus]GEM47427.1 hypothetical protein DC3_30620 [Deinococcus cellulosilyticus NBRC 106333 = KACC 11606]
MTTYVLALIPPEPIYGQVLQYQLQYKRPNMEPHITIKFKAGLTDDLEWLPRVREMCAEVKPFSVHLSGTRTFGRRVLFWDVVSPGAKDLHLKTLQAVGHPPQTDLFEGEAYQMHMTLLYDPKPVQLAEAADLFREADFTATFLRLAVKKPHGRYETVEDLPFLG